MRFVKVTDESTRAEIEDHIRQVLASLRRLPSLEGYQARGHERINALLTDWEAARG